MHTFLLGLEPACLCKKEESQVERSGYIQQIMYLPSQFNSKNNLDATELMRANPFASLISVDGATWHDGAAALE